MPSDKTLLSVMIVIFVVLVAVMLKLAIRPTIRTPALEQRTNNHLRRIVEAQLGYASDAGTWAYPSGLPTPDGSDPREVVEYVGRTFVILAQNNELSASLFVHPSHDRVEIRPTRDFPFMCCSYQELLGIEDPASSGEALSGDEVLRWAASFAYDLAAPQNSDSCRPIIAVRHQDIFGPGGGSVAYADGHANFIEVIPTSEPGVPMPQTGIVLPDFSVVPKSKYNICSDEAAVDDWIYSFDAHLGARYPWRVGRGSSTLAWLR